jgi:carbon-monoxide dehydrogenase medium subunit
MKPAPFTYHAPTALEEAVDILDGCGGEAKVLAGGQSLVPVMAMRLAHFDDIVDLNRIGSLAGIDTADDRVRVGAMTRQASIERNDRMATLVPLLYRAVPHVGHFQIRNRGTIGGSIAHADPAAELPAVAVALDAVMEVTGPRGSRRVPAAEFFAGTMTTTLEGDEILAAVEFPAAGPLTSASVQEVARRSGDFAIAGVVCQIEMSRDGGMASVRIALFGVAPVPVRATQVEAGLLGGAGSDLRALSRAAVGDLDPGDDVHASGAYRRRVTATLIERAVSDALAQTATRAEGV